MLSVELSVEDSEWVEKFIASGGDRNEGIQIRQRMNLAKTGSPPTAKPNDGKWPTSVATEVPGLFPSDEVPVPQSPPSAPAPTDSHAVAAPPATPAPTKKPRGRPPVNWSQRPKSQQELDLFELSLEIEEKNAAEHGQLGFIATAMIYASLPHSDLETAVFKRKNGSISITIMNDPDIGLPFGKIPRIITAFLCTEAKQTASRTIQLGRSQAEFAKKLGLNTGGGKRGDITRLKDQATRLFTSRITLTGTPDSQFHWRNVDLTKDGMLLWRPHDPHAKAAWESRLTLSEEFFEECIAHSVPIDLRVIHKLTSPLAIDIYVWLTYRLNSIAYPTPISWEQLKWQFGANYADDAQGLRNFIVAFKTQLRRVMSVYPDAKISTDSKKLTLIPSKSHITAIGR
ncbi:replication protein RepA [Achromobacter insolitus]|uniref:replication protein RepA n=1 Tax=Achromobacter insolitus TaxID=217204 RepID=UPI000AAEEE7F|nr:replication protein RepA [Achromobacter insolitus]